MADHGGAGTNRRQDRACVVDLLAGPIVTTANLTSTGGTAARESQTFPIALSRRHEPFLVFRTVTGGSTGGNLFNLN